MNSTKQLIKDSIADKKARIAELEAELALDLAALAVFEGGIKKTHKTKKKQKATAKTVGKSPKVKLAHKMEVTLDILDMPLTSSEFMNAVNREFPGTNMTPANWSPQLSSIYRNPKKPFHRLEFPDNPSESRYFYVKKAWVANKETREAYIRKLNGKHRVNSNQLKIDAIYEAA